MSPVLLVLTIAFQLVMFCQFFRESIYTTHGVICRVKCGLAAALYFGFALVLLYGLQRLSQ